MVEGAALVQRRVLAEVAHERCQPILRVERLARRRSHAFTSSSVGICGQTPSRTPIITVAGALPRMTRAPYRPVSWGDVSTIGTSGTRGRSPF